MVSQDELTPQFLKDCQDALTAYQVISGKYPDLKDLTTTERASIKREFMLARVAWHNLLKTYGTHFISEMIPFLLQISLITG